MATKKKKKSPAFAFIVKSLQRKPTASFAEIRDKAAKKGFTIYPISYGRAQRLLGLAGKGQKPKAKVKANAKPKPAAKSAPKRASRKPRKAVDDGVDRSEKAGQGWLEANYEGTSVNDLVCRYADLKGELGDVCNKLERHGITVPA